MMSFVYSIVISVYYFGIWVSQFFSSKSKKWLEGRQEIWEKINSVDLKDCIWVHCASLGEFEQVNFLIQSIKKNKPEQKILLTFFSPSGYEVRKNYPFSDLVCYLPWDTRANMSRFVATVAPNHVFWVRYEFWIYALQQIKKKNIPLTLLNGVFREHINPLYRIFLRQFLPLFDKIFVINEASKSRLATLNIDSEVLSDTRYDRMWQVKNEIFEDELIEKFVQNKRTIICGSTWQRDEDIILAVSKRLEDYNWIVVPHNVNAGTISYLKSIFPKATLYSEGVHKLDSNILVIDQVGFLSKIYRYGAVAYVGGGFDKVVHSTLEPLTYGLPIAVGPHVAKSEDTLELIALQMATIVDSATNFYIFVQENISPNPLKKLQIEAFFSSKMGSFQRVLELIDCAT